MGTEARLTECPDTATVCMRSGSNYNAGVSCQTRTTGIMCYIVSFINVMNISDCTDGQIRLVSYSTPSEGRLEYCQDGVWGTVCNQGWRAADSQVVCRELGYSSSGNIGWPTYAS